MKNPKQVNDIVGVVSGPDSTLTIGSKDACYRSGKNVEVIPWEKLAVTLTQRGHRPKIQRAILHASMQQFQPTNLSYLFADMKNMNEIVGLDKLDVSQAISTRSMFQNCAKLTELDLHTFDTRKVADMRDMFRGCASLQDLYFSPKFEVGFTDDNYLEVKSMFEGCQPNALTHLLEVKRSYRGVPFWKKTKTMRLQDFSEVAFQEAIKEVQHDGKR